MHLADCSACAAYAAELNSLEQELSESLKEHWGDPQPTPGSAGALARQLSQIAKGGGGGPSGPGNQQLLGWLFGAAVVLLAAFWLFGGRGQPDETGEEQQSPTPVTATATATASASPSPTIAVEQFLLLAIPGQDSNCRYGCSASLFDIADTLPEGQGFRPLGADFEGGFFQFSGPTFGEMCWVHESLLDLQINGVSSSLDEVQASGLVEQASCPAPPPTPTPTFDPDEGSSADPPTDTPTPRPPQCSDGIDNDGDGAADYGSSRDIAAGRADRECSSPSDDNEAN
jgi:hypothetical protein